MRDQVFEHLDPASIVIKAAAVADFHLSKVPDQKIKKTAARLSLELDPTPDILAELGRKKGDRLLIGFAAETQNLLAGSAPQAGIQELRHGGGQPGGRRPTWASNPTKTKWCWCFRTGETIPLPRASKREIADRIFDEVLKTAPGPPRRPMDPELLRQYLEYYRDLGVEDSVRGGAAARRRGLRKETARAVRRAEPSGETLFQILEDIGDCRRCRLHEGRTKIVFGVGNEQSPLVFVGEGPGADEDAQGIPFVGRAGQLLTQMIEGTARKEGIQLRARGCLHLQRGEVPAAGQPHAGARRNGDLRPVSIAPAPGRFAPRPSARWAARRRGPCSDAKKASPSCAASGSSGGISR